MSEFEEIVPIPKDIIFPDELNQYLRDQIIAFNHENGMLRKHLQEIEDKCSLQQKEIYHLKNMVKNEESYLLPHFKDPSKTISSKIVELSKNLREKCAELEKFKTKYSKLVVQFEDLKKREVDEKTPGNVSVVVTKSESEADLKQLQDKINVTRNKMLEYKNSNFQLRNELKQANRLLQQEIGEDFNNLQQNNTWKGRAQIICDLQEKNKKLKEKLRNMQENGVPFNTQSQNDKFTSKISALEKENVDLKSINESHKTKMNNLKSRCNMLETGHQELKLKLSQLQERSTKELEIIANMSNQLAEVENKKQKALKEKETEIDKHRIEISNLRDQIEDYKKIVNNLKDRVMVNMNNVYNDCNNDTQELGEQNHLKDQLEILQKKIFNLEKEKIELLKVADLQRQRLEKERNDHEKSQQLYRTEKQKVIRLEAVIAKSDLESASTHRSRYSMMSQTSRNTENNLKDQLQLAEESIKALRTRLELEQLEKREDFKEFAKILKLSNRED